MPYLEVDLDAFKGAQLAAGVLGLPVPQVIGGLNLLWAHAWQRREDHVAGIILEGLFASANPRLGEALEAAGFLERDGETWRVRGCERYLRISEARRKGAAATNAKRALQRQSSDAGATLERRSSDALHRVTDPPTHRSKIKDSSAGADALASAGSRGPTRVPGEAGTDPPSEAASPAPVLSTDEQLAAAVDGYRVEATAQAAKVGAHLAESETARREACREVLEHWASVRGKTPKFDRGDYALVGKQLKAGFTPEELKRAADGLARDPWPQRKLQDGLRYVYGSAETVRKFLALAPAPSAATDAPRAASPPPVRIESASFRRLLDGALSEAARKVLAGFVPVADDEELRLVAPDAFARDWLEDNCGAQLEQLAGKRVRVVDRVPDERAVS